MDYWWILSLICSWKILSFSSCIFFLFNCSFWRTCSSMLNLESFYVFIFARLLLYSLVSSCSFLRWFSTIWVIIWFFYCFQASSACNFLLERSFIFCFRSLIYETYFFSTNFSAFSMDAVYFSLSFSMFTFSLSEYSCLNSSTLSAHSSLSVMLFYLSSFIVRLKIVFYFWNCMTSLALSVA